MKALKVLGFRTDWSRADEPMARAPEMTLGKISLASGIHCCSNLLFLRPTSVSLLRGICVYIHIFNYVENVCVLPLLSKLASETLLHKSAAVRSVDWIFITGMPALPWLGEYVTLDKTSQSFFQTGSSRALETAKFSSLSHSSRRHLLEI